MNDENDDGQHVDLTPEQLYQLMHADIGGQLLGLAASFAPDFPQEHLGEVVEGMVREQMTIAEQIMPSLTDPEILKKRSRFIIEIQKRHPESGDEPFTMIMQKRLENCKTPFDALGSALLIAFLLSPATRALLRMYGWDYTFKEPKRDNPAGLVLLKSP